MSIADTFRQFKADRPRARIEAFRRTHDTELTCLLFTDLVDSTKLKDVWGDRKAVGLIRAHRALVRRLLKGYSDSHEVETAGDSFFCVFKRPSEAAAFAVRLQAGMRREFSSHRLAVRVGIHLGEVVVEQHRAGRKPLDLYGMQIDIAARVMSLAEGGQVLCTRAVFDNARQVLRGRGLGRLSPLVWLAHGPYSLKGIEDPVDVCEVGEEGEGVLRAPKSSEKARAIRSAEEELGWRPAPGARVPGTAWTLDRRLGAGGFGEVWLATHRETHEKRVFKFSFVKERWKTLRRELAHLQRIRRECGDHPGIVRLHEVFFEEPPYYLGFEYVQGRNLERWLDVGDRARTLPTQVRLEIAAQVADALHAAHRCGIVHQDVKPGNILVDDGTEADASGAPRIKLGDFGVGRVVNQEVLAQVASIGTGETRLSGAMRDYAVGSLPYLAPERIEGRDATPRSDLYSLGVVLFQLLTGDMRRALPVVGWECEIADPHIRESLRAVLAPPERRLASAAEFARRLRSWSPGRLSAPPP